MLTSEPRSKKFISLRAAFIFHNKNEKTYWVIQKKESKTLPNIPCWDALVRFTIKIR